MAPSGHACKSAVSAPVLTPRAVADAAFAGWLPLLAVNAAFARRVHMQLDVQQSALHHLYDAGQVLGLAAAAWVVAGLSWRLPRVARLALGGTLVYAAQFALLAFDLESFLARHTDSSVPWHFLFAALGTLAIAACLGLGQLLARSALRFLGVGLGLGLAVSNHLVLPLAYPAVHFILAWAAASLLGASMLHWVAELRLPRAVRVASIAASVLSLLSYVIVPGTVVRGALLGSSGAVAAPFVTRVWTRLSEDTPASASTRDPAWFSPRHDLSAIAAERLPGAPKQPIVILLTIDGLRSDVVEGPGASKKSVPNLLAMSERSLRFERVWAPAPYTMASLRSLFRGTYYSQSQRKPSKRERAAGKRIKVPAVPYLPAVLEQSGVTTVNLRTHKVLARDKGICRGFGEELDLGHAAPSEKVVAAVLERLDARARRPLFIYSHILDTHAPYDRGGKRGSPKQRYVAEVSVVDAAIGELRRELRKRELERSTYLVVTADHAEAFGEHGHYFHASTVYEEMIRIPLFIEGPGIAPRRAQRSVSLLDLGPTILSLFGVDTPAHFMGQSLVPFMRGQDPVLSRPLAVDGGRGIRAMLFQDRWKAIVHVHHGTEELYDLQQDPGEQRNLAERPEARAHFSTLHAFFAAITGTDTNASADVPAPAQR